MTPCNINAEILTGIRRFLKSQRETEQRENVIKYKTVKKTVLSWEKNLNTMCIFGHNFIAETQRETTACQQNNRITNKLKEKTTVPDPHCYVL